MNPFGFGVINLDGNMPADCAEITVAMAILFFIDEVFVKIHSKPHYLQRAVDRDGEVVDVYLRSHREAKAAKRFFKRLINRYRGEPRTVVTDKLRSYGVAHRVAPRSDSRFVTIRKQTRRTIPSTDAVSRAWNAAI